MKIRKPIQKVHLTIDFRIREKNKQRKIFNKNI